VASIQLSANDMVRIGDWISMPKYNADGNVEVITLNTVKVRNWDKTISTIPTYALISESFSNWRGMVESGGRRIKRHINIDMKTITRISIAETKRLSSVFPILQPYLDEKRKENRTLTNIGTFRKYIELYLFENEIINKEMTFLIRQLQPTDKGLPLEIYEFSSDQRWIQYEGIQSDIFDHVLSVIKEFKLAVFQYPNA
jgi:miniconductance mechanosensitive channel